MSNENRSELKKVENGIKLNCIEKLSGRQSFFWHFVWTPSQEEPKTALVFFIPHQMLGL
jgi:hypothetical protein